ncbi:hypothetical protein [[Eubacterium] cellulosolvens]
MNIPWILVSIIITILILAILAIFTFKRKGWNREVDYRTYFGIGIVWVPSGIVFYLIFGYVMGFVFIVMGLVFLAISLKNKDKWGEPQKMSPAYQKALMIAVLGLISLLVLGIIVFQIMR